MRSAKRYLSVISGNTAVLVLRLLVIALASHMYPKAEFADFIYLYQSALLLALFSDFGMRTSTFIEIGKTGQIENDQASQIVTMRALFGSLAFVLTVVWSTAYFLSGSAQGDYIWAIAILFGLFAANTPAADIGLNVIRGKGSASLEAKAKIIEFALVLTLVAIFWFFNFPAVWLIASWVVPAILRSVWAYRTAFSGSVVHWFQISFSDFVTLVKRQIETFLLIFLNTLSMRYVIYLSPIFLGSEDLIFLTLSLMVVQMMQVVSSSIAFQFFGFDKFRKPGSGHTQFRKLVSVVMLIGAVAGLAYWLLADIAGFFLNINNDRNALNLALVCGCFVTILANDFSRFMFVFVEKVRIFNVAIGLLIATAGVFALYLKTVMVVDLTVLLIIFLATQIIQLIGSIVFLDRAVNRLIPV